MTTTIALIAALAALVTALSAAWQVRLLRQQMSDDSRPYVVVDVLPGFHGPGSWDLTLHSTGKSAARRVRITTEPTAWDPLNPSDDITAPLLKYLNKERDLPPGARHRVMWRGTTSGNGHAGAPPAATVTVTYEDDAKKTYKDAFTFDIDVLAEISPVPTEGPRVGNSEEGQELRNIDRAIRTLAQHLGELRR